MKHQRGFGLIVWMVIGAFAVGLGGAVAWKYNSTLERATKAEGIINQIDAECVGRDRDAVKCVKDLKSKLAECMNKYSTSLATIKTQNDALLALKATATAAQDRSKQALKAADIAANTMKSEAERLHALRQKFKAVTACPAGEAVGEFRKGLKKGA